MASAGSGASTTGLWFRVLIAAVALIWVLRYAAVVFIPIAAALFLTALVFPVRSYLESHLPRRLRRAAVGLTMLLVLLVLGGAFAIIGAAVDQAVESAPQYDERLTEMADQSRRWLQSWNIPVSGDLLSSPDARRRLADTLTSVLRSTWEAVSLLIIVLFLLLLLLIEAPVWREKLASVLDDYGATAIATIDEVAEKVRQFLYVRTVMGLLSAVLTGVLLLLTDVDLILTWVVLTFVLNYIPNLGSIIAVVPPSLMAMLQHGFVRGLIVLALLAVMDNFVGNYLDPRMQGRRLALSPVIVLVALVFWTWAWGVMGALLAVPITVAMVVASAHVTRLQPVASLLDGRREE